MTPYPPVRDGIAAYGLQAVARLRRDGHEVEVLSPGPSAAHHHLDLCGPRGALALARRVRSYDKVIVQFHPDVFFPIPCRPRDRTTIALALTTAFRAAHDLEVRVHETDYALGRGLSPSAAAIRAMWRSVPQIVVHTEEERSSLHSAFGVPLSRITVAHHGEDFTPRTAPDRAAARARLGIRSDEVMFLSIGFIQPHKGFDRAVRAFSGLGGRGCRLDVVGSVRVEEPEYLNHLEELEALAARTPGVRVHAGYVSDEAFDRWIVASDVVVLPYRHIWSSGVMERAGLYERPVVATRVGGLAAQARPGTVVVDDDEQLAAALWRLAAERLPEDAPGGAPEPWARGEARREAVQAE
ncbi:MAG: glycosyltransferase family 4 protein, partial [Acidimicrobiales bacterium]